MSRLSSSICYIRALRVRFVIKFSVPNLAVSNFFFSICASRLMSKTTGVIAIYKLGASLIPTWEWLLANIFKAVVLSFVVAKLFNLVKYSCKPLLR